MMQGYANGPAAGFPVLFFAMPPSIPGHQRHPSIENVSSRIWSQHSSHHNLSAALDVQPFNHLVHQHHRQPTNGPTRHYIADILGLDADHCELLKHGDVTRSRDSCMLVGLAKASSPTSPSSVARYHLRRPEAVVIGRQSVGSERSASRESRETSCSTSDVDYVTDDGESHCTFGSTLGGSVVV